MTDTQIRDALERATNHVSSPPDLLERVRDGGRRRVVRRRVVLAGGLAVAVSGSAAGAWAIADSGGEPPVASPLLDGATRGDLRGDQAYLKQVRALLRRAVGDHLPVRGEPHVVWAGTTPAGPVAVVTQRLRSQVVSEVGQVQFGLLAFVQPTAAGPRITSSETMVTGVPNSLAVLTGERRDVLVVLDDGRGVLLSKDFRYAADGRIERTFRPVDFTADGAAVVTLAPQRDRIRIALKPAAAADDPNVSLANLSELIPAGPAANRRLWWIERGVASAVAAPTGAQVPAGWPDLEGRDGYGDRWGIHRFARTPSWYVCGTTPAGHRFAVQTLVQDDERPRLFRLESSGRPHFVGFVEPADPLPVRVRLPGRQGVVVAAENATLRYRAGGGGWLPVTGTAAVLPAAARAVEVTRPGRRPVVVELPA